MYVSYYFYGYVMCGFAALIWLYNFTRQRQRNSAAVDKYWRACEQTTACWTFSFMFTFLINTLVPARSPRLHFKDLYQRPLMAAAKASGDVPKPPSAFSQWLNRTIHQDNTYGSFPSGHVGETLAVAISGLVVGKRYQNLFVSVFGNVVLAISFVMALATLWLRYHYFSDVLAAIAVAFASMGLTNVLHNFTQKSNERAKVAAAKAPIRQQLLATATTLAAVDEHRRAAAAAAATDAATTTEAAATATTTTTATTSSNGRASAPSATLKRTKQQEPSTSFDVDLYTEPDTIEYAAHVA